MVPADATRQLSYSGTPRDSRGWTTPDEYVTDLADPIKRMEKFEEMGNDDAVHTALDARRQETCSANWQLSTEDESPRATEILEFVEDNIYPVIDDLLRWLAGGALQYGFGAVEPVFQWSDRPIVSAIARGKVKRPTRNGERRIYLSKLAHIRQPAVQTFKISPTGDLEAIVQHVYNGVAFRQIEVPAEKVLMWTYNRQGDDYWGTPPTRHCYKAWTFKTQIERLNILSIDRFGVGVPVVEEPEGGFTPVERSRLEGFLQAFRSSDRSYVMHPSGGKISILTANGEMQSSALEWAKFYNLAVAKVFLTQQTELGSTETGARALAEQFYEQLGSIVQADCEELATLINNKLIVRLVDWNFGPHEAYPMFAPSQRVKSGSGVATVIGSLISAKIIHPRPEDEAYFRDVFEMPQVELATLKAEDGERQVMAKAAADAKAKQIGSGQPAGEDEEEELQLRARRAVRQLGAGETPAGAPEPAVQYKTTYRTDEYSEWENGILQPWALLNELELQHSRTAGEVQDVLRDIDEDLARQVERLAAKGASSLSAGVRNIVVAEKLRTKLRKSLLTAAARARAFGSIAVRNEIERQLAPAGVGPVRTYPTYDATAVITRQLAIAGEEKTTEDLHLEAEVDRAVENEIDRREQSARDGALTALAQAAGAAVSVLTSVAVTAAKAGLIGLSTGRTRDNVEGVVNVGFGIGRAEQARAIIDGGGSGGNRSGLRRSDGSSVELVSKVYSAVMDGGTCAECSKYDGAEFPIDFPEDFTGVQAPNPRCAGTYKRCRCVWIYVTDRESIPLVPASKGPVPIRGAA